jgi:RNA ligase (TIGR02306 family)
MQASIQRILEVKPVENADSLDKVYVLGWQVVAKRGEFKAGDLAVYVSIDSILPPRPEFEFLAKSHYRVKTIKLRGELSQGIVFPLSILPPLTHLQYKLGQDVTETLEVKHYEKPVPNEGFNQGDTKGNWPPFFPHTDEERIQNVPEVLDELRGKSYIITEKCDGTSCTIYFNRGEFGVCSRNFEKKDSEGSVYWQVARKYDLENKLKNFGPNIAIQGELCGPGIQKNKLGLKEHDLFVFDIYDIDDGKYMAWPKQNSYIVSLGLNKVPIVEYGEGFHYTLEELLEKAKGQYAGTNNHREGIVVRAMYGDFSEKMRSRISFKVLNNEFLLKEGE